MLSSISNSNFRVKVITLLLLSFALYLTVNVIAFKYSNYYHAALEKNDIYKSNLVGMHHLMMRQYAVSAKLPLDIIFVGNSTTKVQINSKIFQAQNIQVFNFGLLGRTVYHYPAMVRYAIKQKPKIIVLSFKAPEFYYPLTFYYKNYAHDLDLKLASLKYVAKYIKNDDDRVFFKDLILSYLTNKNYFKLYGYDITDWLKSNFKIFYPETIRDVDYLPESFYCSYPSTHSSSLADCSNGDVGLKGIGKETENYFGKTVNHSSASYNYSYVAMINGLIDEIKKAGIRPVIVFVPEYMHHVYENDNLIKSTLHADIVELSDLNIPREAWKNPEHLNIKGRDVYSEKVVQAIKPLLKNPQA